MICITLDVYKNNRTNMVNIQKDLGNQKYSTYIFSEVLLVSRLVSILGIVMFLGFFIIDLWAFSTIDTPIIVTRLVVAFTLALVLLSSYNYDFFRKFHLLILPVPYVVAISGLNYIISIAEPTDYASNVYFAGLMLIIMMLFAWSFLKTTTSLSISIFMLILYSAAVMNSWTGTDEELFVKLLTTMSFLISSAVIGFISQLIRDRHLKENYALQQSLGKALEDKTEEAEDNAYLANHDTLTGLANRRYVTEQLENSLEEAKAKDKLLLVMFIDLNGFKQINDIYGHAVGDEVLKIIARRLELAVRKNDSLSRLGGDEYLIGLQVAKENLSEVESMVKKYETIISDTIKVDGVKLQVGASIGVAAYPIHGNNIKVLMDIADKKMYQVKHGEKDKKLGRDKEDTNEAVVMFPGRSRP